MQFSRQRAALVQLLPHTNHGITWEFIVDSYVQKLQITIAFAGLKTCCCPLTDLEKLINSADGFLQWFQIKFLILQQMMKILSVFSFIVEAENVP